MPRPPTPSELTRERHLKRRLNRGEKVALCRLDNLLKNNYCLFTARLKEKRPESAAPRRAALRRGAARRSARLSRSRIIRRTLSLIINLINGD